MKKSAQFGPNFAKCSTVARAATHNLSLCIFFDDLIGIQEASFYYLHTLHLFMHCVLKDYKLPFKALDTICT